MRERERESERERERVGERERERGRERESEREREREWERENLLKKQCWVSKMEANNMFYIIYIICHFPK